MAAVSIPNFTAIRNAARSLRGLSSGTDTPGGAQVSAVLDGVGTSQTETGTVTGVATPAVPATTVAAANNTGFDVLVTIVGGTITQINVAGTNTGMTGGTFVLPAGASITLTYSVAPTWYWTALTGRPAGFALISIGGLLQKLPFFNP